jgi:hypothetical protein
MPALGSFSAGVFVAQVLRLLPAMFGGAFHAKQRKGTGQTAKYFGLLSLYGEKIMVPAESHGENE